MNPQDFHRLRALDHDLEELAGTHATLGDLALKAHEIEDRPGTPVEDPDEIKALLGL